MPIQAEVLEAQVRVTGVQNARRDLRGLENQARTTGRGVEKAGSGMRRAFAGFAVGAAAAGGVKLLKSAADAASDLNETVSMSSVIFGKNQKAMDRWANNAWKSVGLGKNAALGAAAGFGDMFAQLGFTQRQAAKMSRTVVQMSADLGSFKNLKTAEVTDMMSAAFRGEYDSLQRVIPNINAARVETEALAETHKKNAKELTASEKAQATLNIVMKDGKRAQGDFAKTSSGAANQQKILQAQIENTRTKVGQSLLPAYREFWKFSNDKVVPAFNEFVDGMKSGEGAGGAFARGIKTDVVPVVKTLADTGKELLPVLKGMGTLTQNALGLFQQLPGPLRSNALLLGGMALGFSKLGAAMGPTIADLGTAEGRAARATTGLQRFGAMSRNVAGAGGLLLLTQSMQTTNRNLSLLEGAAGGALSGAALGAFAGPPGIAVGTAIGAIGGGLLALVHNTKKSADEAVRAKLEWQGYGDTLDAISSKATKATRRRVAENIGKNRDKLPTGPGITDKVLLNAVLDRGNAMKVVTAEMDKQYAAAERTKNADLAAYQIAKVKAQAVRATKNYDVDDLIAANKTRDAAKSSYESSRKRLETVGQTRQEQANFLAGLRAEQTQNRILNAQALTYKDLRAKGIDKPVAVEIDRKGLGPYIADVANLVSKFKILDSKKWKPILEAAGIKPTKENVAALRRQLDSMAKNPVVFKTKAAPPTGFGSLWSNAQAWANAHPITIPTKTKGSADGGTIVRGMAFGGTVPGQREPYGDKVLRMLAPGEEVITNRNGEADRFRAMRKAGLIPGMAKGGTVGGKLAANIKGMGLTDAVREGLGPVSRILDRMEKGIRKATDGKREKRLLGILKSQGDRLEKVQKRRDVIAAKLNAAVSKRDALVAARADFKSNVTEGIKSQANVLNAGNSASEIAANLGTQAAKAQEFAKVIQDMRKAGYSSAVIQQVAGAGIEGGLEVGKALVAGSKGDVSAINASFKSITDTAGQQGELLAKQFYDAGIKSANGVVKGLQSQKNEIEKTLTVIAKGMVKALRKALGIKSPSKVMRAEMKYVGAGIVGGLADQHKAVSRSGGALAGALLGGYRMGNTKVATSSVMGGTGQSAVVMNFHTYNPVAEPQSRTTNNALARVAALNLV